MKNITPEIEQNSTEQASEIKELLPAINENRVPANIAANLMNTFAPMSKAAHELIKQSEGITDAKIARACRLKLRGVRIEVENARKAAKEDSLRTGKAIDGMANILKFLIEPVEERLDAVERAGEIAAAKRREELQAQRAAQLAPFGIDPSFYQLGTMPEETWVQLLDNSRIAFEAKIAAAKAAEEARIKSENDRLKEEARIREENAKLKAEADRREAQLKAEREAAAKAAHEAAEKAAAEKAEIERKARAEREAAEAKARKEREEIEAKAAAERLAAEKKAAAEREAREKLEAAERARIAEEKRKAEAEAAAKLKAEQAPDREKVLALADSFYKIELPALSTNAGKIILKKIQQKIAILAEEIRQQAESL